jgi:protein-tyrosine kinase
MSIVEQAAKRLEELRRAGVAVPWNAAGLAGSESRTSIEGIATDRVRNDAAPGSSEEAMRLGRALPLLSAVPEVVVPATPRRPVADQECVALDIPELERAGHLVPTHARSRLAEEFRHIKRPLLRNARGGSPEQRMSLLMVTSAFPAEGKTFCAINLAMSMAIEVDTAVILVDADVVRPDVLGRLGLSPRKGLLDVLTSSDVDLSDVLLSTNVPKLSLLPAGTQSSRATELLASDAMNRLLADLATHYRDHIIVFDAPPLLVTTEANVLASRVGQVLVVVEASKTPRSAVARAFAALENCPTVMSLLNRGDEPASRYGYADYYG